MHGADMKHLRQFLIVADCGSISRAAARLNMSQPTLSRSIRNFEAERGVALFERHGEGVSLTKYGQIMYSHAVGIINNFDRAAEEIEELQGSGKSSLRIAAGDLWGYEHLPPIIREFAKTHPDVLINIDIVSHANRLDGLRNGTYDLAFGIIDPSVESLYSLTFLKFKKEGFRIYADESHPLRKLDRVTQQDLHRYRWVNHRFEYGLKDEPGQGEPRDYAIKANTLLNTVRMIKGSELLISATSGFDDLFKNFQLAPICDDTSRRVLDSGAIYWGTLEEKPNLRRFVDLVKRRITMV